MAPWRIALFVAGMLGMAALASGDAPRHLKYHPGAYLLTWWTANKYDAAFKLIANEPAFTGVERRYPWSSLEPAPGQYDFSAIERDLHALENLPVPKRLFIEITDNGAEKDGSPHVPVYLRTAEYGGGAFTSAIRQQTVAKRWNTAVQDREIALFQALGKRFDNEAYLEGVVLDETATGIRRDEWDTSGYTAERMYTGEKRLMSGLKKAFPQSVCIQYINYFSGASGADAIAKVIGLMEYARDIGMGFGGPDVHVDGDDPSYPFYAAYAGKVPLAVAVQWEDYDVLSKHTGSRVTAQEILDFALRRLHPDYIFWLERTPYFLDEVVPAVRAAAARAGQRADQHRVMPAAPQ